MGKLKDSLVKLVKDIDAVKKSADATGTQMEKVASNAWQIMQMSAGGVDETFLYINQKLKKDKKKVADVKKQPIKDFEDANVKKFIKGIDDGRKQSVKFVKAWDQLSNDLDKKVTALDKSVTDIAAQIGKKKKKLLKSKKYKQKIGIYENWLSGLKKDIEETKKSIKDMKWEQAGPSESKINKALDITSKTTIGELDSACSMSVKSLLKKYEDVKKQGAESKRKLRQAGDFKAELNTLKQMLADADGMEEEEEEIMA